MAKLALCLFLLLALVCGLALARPSSKKTTTTSDNKKNVPQELTLNSDLSSLVLVRKSGLALSSPAGRGGQSHISPDYRLLRSPRYFGPQEVEFGSIEDSEDWGIPTRGRRYKIVSSSSKKRQQPWQKRQRDDDDDDDDEEDDESAEDDDGSEEDDLVT
jgi:hypothetical protein